MTPAGWAAARLVPAPGADPIPAASLRADYLMWHSDFGPSAGRPAPSAEVNRAVAGVGGTRKMKGADGSRGLHFANVAVRPLPGADVPRPRPAPDAERADEATVLSALSALHSAGLVTDPRALDTAAARLASLPTRLCSGCGRITRRRRAHVGCAA